MKVMSLSLNLVLNTLGRLGLVKKANLPLARLLIRYAALQTMQGKLLKTLKTAFQYYSWTDLFLFAPPPEKMQLGLVSYCNLRCPFCSLTVNNDSAGPTRSVHREKKMSDETLIRCLDGAKDLGCEIIEFTFFGEALLHDGVFRYIEEAKDRGFFVRLHTNGNTAGNVDITKLLETRIDEIVFSIDAADAGIYKILRAGGEIARVQKNLSLLRNGINERGLKTRISCLCIAQPEWPDEWKEVIKTFGAYVDDFSVSPLYASKSHDSKLVYRWERCPYLWYMVSVHPDGDISFCCTDENKDLLGGNIKEQSLADIWHGKKAQEFRKGLRSRDPLRVPALCAGCQSHNNSPPFELVNSLHLSAKSEQGRSV